jgi:peptidoglycan/xylan/chitin deacetylase (PgdA/CDA1 family)
MKPYLGLLLVLLSAMPCALAAPEAAFTITVNPAMQKKFGFQYPATYIFEVDKVSTGARVERLDGSAGRWVGVVRKKGSDFFNGIECVRFDAKAGRAYVSTGFKEGNTIRLRFAGVGAARFHSVAKYYDARKAAYTLSNDNWGCNPWAHPGAPWRGITDDESDSYQAAVRVCRKFHMPLSVAINSRAAGGDAVWRNMQDELDRGDASWEPAVHGWTHPKEANYLIHGYKEEILGCREDILRRLRKIPYGQYVVEHILTFGYVDEALLRTAAGEFLFLRGFNWLDNPSSNDYAAWNKPYGFYGVAGLNTKGYDTILQRREPRARYCASDVAELNEGFDRVHDAGGIFYALWHPDRFLNSVIYDPRPGVDGVQGSTLMQHLAHVANRKDVWYVANGWLYTYRYVAANARVTAVP